MSTGARLPPPPVRPARRWRRYRFDLPVRLNLRGNESKVINCRGRDLNEGGIAVAGEVNLQIGDHVRLEFAPPCAQLPVKVRAAVRDRADQFYGLEFLTTCETDAREVALLRLFVQSMKGRFG